MNFEFNILMFWTFKNLPKLFHHSWSKTRVRQGSLKPLKNGDETIIFPKMDSTELYEVEKFWNYLFMLSKYFNLPLR